MTLENLRSKHWWTRPGVAFFGFGVCVGCVLVFAGYKIFSWSFNDFEQKFAEDITRATQEELVEAVAVPVPQGPEKRLLTVGAGDTLAKMLGAQKIPSNQVHQAITSLKKHYDPRRLAPTHEIELTVETAETNPDAFDLCALRIRPALDQEVRVNRHDKGGFTAEKRKIKLEKEIHRTEGSIETSLYNDAFKQGVPGKTIHDMIMVYSFDVDFQRTLQSGDTYELMYTMYRDPETNKQRPGELLYATLKTGKKNLQVYRYQPKGETSPAYFNQNGESVRKALLRTPVDGARISGRFGNRFHPVLGFTKKHKGVDFAVPKGTPIMAAGDGVIEKIGRWGSYGNYIRIRHNSTYATAYAHLSRYGRNLKRGSRVCQGDLVGYVGSTGRATGPHLHYEVLRHSVAINPLSVTFLPTDRLKGAQLKDFELARKKIEQDFATLQRLEKTV